MAKKNDELNDAPEYPAVSIDSLTEEFGGDAAAASRVMEEIGALGGFGSPSPFSTFALIQLPPDKYKQSIAIIEKAKKESAK